MEESRAEGATPLARAVVFGALVRQHRLARELTQAALAELAGLSVEAISVIERGKRSRTYPATISRLAEALALTAEERAAFLAAYRGTGRATPPGQIPRMRLIRSVPRRPTLVGRAGERARLERHLAGDGPPVLLLAGEPGIGKTSLLGEAAGMAAAMGWTVLQGGCQRRGGQEPLAPFPAALAQFLAPQAPERLAALLQGCARLVRLLPELAQAPLDAPPVETLNPEQERRLIFAAVVRFMANAAGPAGTLLLLDDLQWADADAFDLLVSVVRAPAGVPLRVVGAYRDTEVPPDAPLAVALGDLTQARLATRRGLSPLSPAEAAQLLDALLANDMPGPELRAQVLQRAGGVPFFLVSCADGLRRDGEDVAGMALPWDVAQSVRQRVAAVPELARHVLGLLAAIGRSAPYALLRTVVGQPDHALLAALEAACRAHLLVEQSDAAYCFTHDIIREVVEADLGAARRLLLHRDIARALEARPGPLPVEELAYHYARSDQPEQALPYLERAAERARVAAAHQEAVALLAQAIALARWAGRDDLLGDLHARRGKALYHLTRWAEACEEMHAALARVPPERAEQRAEVLVDVGIATHWLYDAAGTRRYADEALALAEGCGREDLATAALSSLVLADSADGQLHAGIERYSRAAARAGDRYPAQLALGAEFAGMMHYYLAEFDEAILRLREAVAMARAAYDTTTALRALGDLGCALMGSGRYAEALTVFAEGQQESLEQHAVNWVARTTAMRGGLHLEVFDYGGAETLAEEARELSRSTHFISPIVSAGIDLLLNFTRRGELGRAEGLVAEVAAGVVGGQGAHGWLWALRFAQAQAELALARGNPEHALQHAAEAVARSRAVGRVKYEVAGLQVRGQVLAVLGRRHEAIAQLQGAVARARGTGDPAMFLRPAAALLAIAGDDALLTEARAMVERIAAALPEGTMRRHFLAAEPVRVVIERSG
jgi:tetratricopeptide (TPR) repeat protein/transcriptional regulator with XRE-family HTH domain